MSLVTDEKTQSNNIPSTATTEFAMAGKLT